MVGIYLFAPVSKTYRQLPELFASSIVRFYTMRGSSGALETLRHQTEGLPSAKADHSASLFRASVQICGDFQPFVSWVPRRQLGPYFKDAIKCRLASKSFPVTLPWLSQDSSSLRRHPSKQIDICTSTSLRPDAINKIRSSHVHVNFQELVQSRGRTFP